MREPAKKSKNGKKMLFLDFWGQKIAKKSKYQKTVHNVFEGPYKDDLLKFVANFAENCGFASTFCVFHKCTIFCEKCYFGPKNAQNFIKIL